MSRTSYHFDVFLGEGLICISQEQIDETVQTVRIDPDQLPLLFKWLNEVAKELEAK